MELAAWAAGRSLSPLQEQKMKHAPARNMFLCVSGLDLNGSIGQICGMVLLFLAEIEACCITWELLQRNPRCLRKQDLNDLDMPEKSCIP
jgi:hypothetical protein